jgi:GNAT superfamily N-acetyltransferase
MLTATPATHTLIRDATITDVPRLVAMGQRFRAESRYVSRLSENLEQMATLATHLITTEHGLVLVAERQDVVIGMIGLARFAHPISGEMTVGELFFWVEPEHRGHGLRLLRRAEAWAREQRATAIQLIAPTSEVGALYLRLGYTPLEISYQKEL